MATCDYPNMHEGFECNHPESGESEAATLARWAREDRAYAQAEAEWRAGHKYPATIWQAAEWQFSDAASARVAALLAATPFA